MLGHAFTDVSRDSNAFVLRVRAVQEELDCLTLKVKDLLLSKTTVKKRLNIPEH